MCTKKPKNLSFSEADQINLYTGAIKSSQSRKFFSILLSEINWYQPKINIFGRTSLIPRLSAWHGDSFYTYSGIRMDPASWTPTLELLKNRAQSITGKLYNSVLLNLYRDGKDSISWHSDNEPELGLNPSIASMTLGSERKFEFRQKTNSKKKISLSLLDGSLLFMAKETQKNWYHTLPKTKKTNLPRIN